MIRSNKMDLNISIPIIYKSSLLERFNIKNAIFNQSQNKYIIPISCPFEEYCYECCPTACVFKEWLDKHDNNKYCLRLRRHPWKAHHRPTRRDTSSLRIRCIHNLFAVVHSLPLSSASLHTITFQNG